MVSLWDRETRGMWEAATRCAAGVVGNAFFFRCIKKHRPTLSSSVPVRTVGDSSYRLRDLTLRFYDADALQPVDADVS